MSPGKTPALLLPEGQPLSPSVWRTMSHFLGAERVRKPRSPPPQGYRWEAWVPTGSHVWDGSPREALGCTAPQEPMEGTRGAHVLSHQHNRSGIKSSNTAQFLSQEGSVGVLRRWGLRTTEEHGSRSQQSAREARSSRGSRGAGTEGPTHCSALMSGAGAQAQHAPHFPGPLANSKAG